MTSLLGNYTINAKVTWQSEDYMTKEEILEMSRRENKGKDIVDIESSKRGVWAGWIVVISLSILLSLYDYFSGAKIPFEMLSALSTGLAVVFFIKFSMLKKIHELIVALIYSSLAVLLFILWITL